MKKIVILAAFCCFSANAMADDMYAGVNLGFGSSNLKAKFNGTEDTKKVKPINFDLGFGTYITPAFRAELSGFFLSGKSKKFDSNLDLDTKPGLEIKSENIGAMVNGYYDFNFFNNFVPYAMAGVGFARTSYKISGEEAALISNNKKNKKKNGIAYQAGVGLDYLVSDTHNIGLNYKYIQVGSSKANFEVAGTTDKLELKHDPAHVISLGLKVHF